ncbi:MULTISPECIES: tRNA uridine-5-carboxymethylaminomethyl(34) synthesis GTPase MnmE [unclassified Sphingobium]|uniref:tRNA uridine-5-carboxymethylaminomethyl(34) synthesis GTPase MnmE n=1 Tax=unclassified Sphingobium TaxID=2611147 RepID=UPI000D151D48|nr:MULTISPECIES: tRNA uridine-5-carboxymethylaminomethyl(34) synthesis GTPase MnmE [unclassified Sphingobium]MBG6118304.1 tRNA modification GTPase [Sphingobium sp. JAI105]PSO11583.1 tRNA uridine-5-carboxymethylaminomethyl(34) synthesis GTPase MnmE [Sphingobium sp. AEW4]TWD07884.1 tRNA modification GTPase trmE [Sphingobium sp. AEW010]TWD24846.1 tRNA modification GTPase trmE [Sphingobium sp. AEW013]TWD26736.1 tRNA modification GTPase trmE [Sphingobium sp. AEW001]
MTDTIFALSSGAPPAGIAVIRVSGPAARAALERLARRVPPPRTASLALLVDPQDDAPLDRALTLWLPGPATVTGEDLVELHCHGGRAVVAAVEAALAAMPGLRRAEAGEFTRRAFANGRMDLNAVEGLADLLAAETQQQRRAALMMAEGHFSRRIEGWRATLLDLSAMAEAALDFSDEDDVPDAAIEERIGAGIMALAQDVAAVLAAPSAERLRDGVRVVLAGPPNAGKSTLLNALVGRDAAIVSDIAGTTRDRIEVPAAIGGVAFLFTDTAGLRDETGDAIEAIGIDRARSALAAADIILWLGDDADAPRDDAILIAAQCDRDGAAERPGLRLSARTGEGMDALVALLLERAAHMLPGEGDYALHARQRQRVGQIAAFLHSAAGAHDLLILAEELRQARREIDALTGQAGTEDMLDRLFAGFCIGK